MGNSEWGSEKPFKKKICCEKKMYLEKEPEGCKMSAISLGPWARGRGHGAETHLRPVPRTRVRLCSAECDIVLFLSFTVRSHDASRRATRAAVPLPPDRQEGFSPGYPQVGPAAARGQAWPLSSEPRSRFGRVGFRIRGRLLRQLYQLLVAA